MPRFPRPSPETIDTILSGASFFALLAAAAAVWIATPSDAELAAAAGLMPLARYNGRRVGVISDENRPALFVLRFGDLPILTGSMSALYAAAENLGLVGTMITQDGTKIRTLVADCTIAAVEHNGPIPPILRVDGAAFVDGEPLPCLQELVRHAEDFA